MRVNGFGGRRPGCGAPAGAGGIAIPEERPRGRNKGAPCGRCALRRIWMSRERLCAAAQPSGSLHPSPAALASSPGCGVSRQFARRGPSRRSAPLPSPPARCIRHRRRSPPLPVAACRGSSRAEGPPAALRRCPALRLAASATGGARLRAPKTRISEPMKFDPLGSIPNEKATRLGGPSFAWCASRRGR